MHSSHMDRPGMAGWIRKGAPVLLALALAAVYLLSPPRYWQVEGNDELQFVGLAHSLKRGEGYTLDGRPHVLYPPAYPWLLSRILPDGDDPGFARLYRLNGFLGLAAIGLAAYWAYRRAGWPGALLVGSAYYAWSFSCRFLMAEPLYMVFSWSALLAVSAARSRAVAGPDGKSPASPRRGAWCLPAVAATGLLLATATKNAAISLTAAMCVSAGVWALRTRFRQGVIAGLLAAGIGGGAWLGWEFRGKQLQDDSQETYAQWTTTLLKAQGSVPASLSGIMREPLKPGLAAWPERAAHLVEKTGQTLLSLVRPPHAARGLMWGVAALFFCGLFRALRRDPGCPAAWYTLISWLMFSLTVWATSYTRYIYLILPAALIFALEGGRWLLSASGRMPRAVIGLWAAVTLGFAAVHFPRAGDGGRFDFAYAAVWSSAAVALSLAALLRAAGFRLRAPWAPWALGAALLLHNGGLMVSQKVMASRNHTARARAVFDAQLAAEWIRARTPADSTGTASLPRFARVITGRACAGSGDEARIPESSDWVLLTGWFNLVPGYVSHREQLLREKVSAGPWRKVHQEGRAVVYFPPLSSP